MSEYTMQELMQLLENISDNKPDTIDSEMDAYFGSKPGVLEEEETPSLEDVKDLVMQIGNYSKKLKENMDDNFEALADLLKEQAEYSFKVQQNFDERITNLEELLSSDRTIN